MTFPPSDVFVIGGGPIGLAAAIAARRKGLRVTVADALEPPIDKSCGEGVLPDGVAAAARLGIDLAAIPSFSLRGIRFHGEDVMASADFPERPGRGIRRTMLHRALADHAERSGVHLCWRATVNRFDDIEARWIIGADGMASRVRAWAGLDRFRRDSRRYGFRAHFQRTPWSDHVDIHWADGYQVYITPVGPEEVGIALLTRDPKLRFPETLARLPALAANLAGAPKISTERGALTASRCLRGVTGRKGSATVALIGDASGSVDAISGEGLCLGFHQALALADAIERENPERYEIAHRRLSRRPRLMADLMLTMDQRPQLRRRVLPALAAHPELFARLLATHVGAGFPAGLAAACLALGWRILTA
jgi:flavin-dependent dehydrogenase